MPLVPGTMKPGNGAGNGEGVVSVTRYLSLLRNRNFLRYWLAGALAHVGDFFNTLALVKLFSQDPDRLGFYTSLVVVGNMLPTLLLGPVAGVLADRLPRKLIMVTADLVRAALMFSMMFVHDPLVLIGIDFTAAVAAAFFGPASSALLPRLVQREELATAGSLNIMTQRLAMLFGNGLGAVLLGLVGPAGVFAINTGLFLASGLLHATMRAPETAPAEAGSRPAASPLAKLVRDLREAAAVVRERPNLLHLLAGLCIANFGDSGSNVLLVTFFTVTLGVAAEQLGFVMALFGGAAVLGAFAIGAVGNRVHWRHLFSLGCCYVWFTATGAVVVRSLIPSSAFLLLLGLGSGAINVGLQVAIADLVPDNVRGRIFGSFGTISSLIMIVGTLLAGVLADRFGAAATMLGYALFYLAAGIYGYQKLRPEPAPAAQAASARAD